MNPRTQSLLRRLIFFYWAFLISSGALPAATRPPNILLIIGDDLSFHDLGCWGNRDVHTPNIDRLASEGLRLTRCFAPAPMCSPLRQSLYTGLHPVKNGAYPNHSFVKLGTKSLPHHLQPLGYRVGLVGKTHFGPPDCYPFEYPGRKHNPTNSAATPSAQPSEQIGSLDIGAIGEFIRRDPSAPFCLVAASNEPHSPWNRGDASRYDPLKLKLPPYFVDTPETRAALASYYAEVTVLDEQVGRILQLLTLSGQASNTFVLFISEQGSSFPHSKWTLYEPGLRGALIARWPGRIAAGTTTDALGSYVDILPTLIELAGGVPVQGLAGSSLWPLLAGRTNQHADYIFAEQTSRGIVNGPSAFGIRCVRDGRYKLILNLNPEIEFRDEATAEKNPVFTSWRKLAETDSVAREQVNRYLHRPALELYDCESDPWETNNLAADPAQQSRVKTLRAKLDAWMKAQGDVGVATELAANKRQGGAKKAAAQAETE